MNPKDICFNFIDKCNNRSHESEMDNAQLFAVCFGEQIKLDFLKFVNFDPNYDCYYYSSRFNNGNISYYGNSVLTERELSDLQYVFFRPQVVEQYIAYLNYANVSSSRERFLHFWLISRYSYKIKVEPCDVHKGK